MPENDANLTQTEPSVLARAISALTGLIEHFRGSSRTAPNRSSEGGSTASESTPSESAQSGNTHDEPAATQPVEDGEGPIIERSYRVDFTSDLEPEVLMRSIKANLADLSPQTLAAFEKSSGHPWAMRVGDEYQITILGPWNGAVRVTESAPRAFSFVTLEGHPEAGTIRFSIRPHPSRPGVSRFEIRSRARARDALVQAAYSALKVGQAVQESMWTTFCERVVEASGGQAIGPIEVSTLEERDGPHA
jgi:hypothetical protein